MNHMSLGCLPYCKFVAQQPTVAAAPKGTRFMDDKTSQESDNGLQTAGGSV